jgi:uncharacterized membrane protein
MAEKIRPLISAFLIAAMLTAACIALATLPPGTRVPVHFGLDGQPDSWDSIFPGVFMMPGVAVLGWALAWLLPRIDPRGHKLAQARQAIGTIMLTVTGFCAVLQYQVLAGALHGHELRLGLITTASGALLIAIGNVFGKLPFNYTVGLRTPWTLADERVWDASQRFAGRALVIAGILVVLSGLLLPPGLIGAALFAGAVVTATLLSVGHSYLLWRNRETDIA